MSHFRHGGHVLKRRCGWAERDRQPLAATIAGAADGWGDKHFFEELAHDLETSAGATNRDLLPRCSNSHVNSLNVSGEREPGSAHAGVLSVTDAGAFLFDKDPEASPMLKSHQSFRWLLL
jgi:hypothetical protein